MNLSEKTIKTCKLSAPVLTKHSKALTSRLYEILFENYPETKVLFGGAPKDQDKKFTNAILTYSNNIDNLRNVDKAVDDITKSHMKMYVKPEYYPIVEVSLLRAIKDVFGDAATDDIIEAWKEAYSFLGDILISREKELYASA